MWAYSGTKSAVGRTHQPLPCLNSFLLQKRRGKGRTKQHPQKNNGTERESVWRVISVRVRDRGVFASRVLAVVVTAIHLIAYSDVFWFL